MLPELPPRDGEEGWSPTTLLMWEAWRQDPVTAQWSPSDVAYALDTIRLYEGMTPSGANEVRIRMDGLGLTPKGKRDLRWRVPQPAQVVSIESARPERKSAAERMRELRERGDTA